MSSEVGIAILIGLGIGIGVLALSFAVMRLAKRGKLDKLVKQAPSTAAPEATFDVGELMISPVEAREGERVSISYRVTNIGNTRGVYKVGLRINGAEVSRLDIDLAPEGTELVTFAVVETAAGEYKVEVDGLEGIFVITSARLSVRAIDINPQRAKEGEHVSITAEVTNSGGSTGAQKLNVELRDEVLFSREVTVAPGATEKVNVTLTNLKPGIYEVKMGDFRTTFMVEMSDYIEPI